MPAFVASHLLALGLGMATRPKPNVTAAVIQPAKREPEDKLKLADFIVRTKPESDGDRPRQGPSHEEIFAQKVAAVPTDADVAAIVKAGAPDPEGDVTDEAEVAFAAWLDRDPVAALAWRREWALGRRTMTSAFDKSLQYFALNHSPAELDRAIMGADESGRTLFYAAALAAHFKGIDTVMAMAGGMSRAEDRNEMISFGLRSTEGLAAHLPAIRSLLNEAGVGRFLQRLSRLEKAGELLPALTAAGFPEESLTQFESWAAAEAEEQRVKALPLLEKIRANAGDATQIGYALNEGVPEFDDWCRDFGDSRMSADEVMERLQTAVGGGKLDATLDSFAFQQLFAMNPAAAIQWRRQVPGDAGAWQAAVQDALWEEGPSLEVLEAAAGTMSDDEMAASGVKGGLVSRYGSWAGRDFESAAAAARRLPDGPLKQEVEHELLKERQKQEEMKRKGGKR